MGGTGGYARPVEPTDGRMASWLTHTNRGIPSSEPGVDYYCPIGTPIRSAASGVVVDVGTSIMPATGRYITVDLDDGRRVRYLHILRHKVGVGERVRWGEHIADSGATGYGEQDWSWNVAGTGGAHVHMTLFRDHSYRFGRYATLDPEQYMAAHQGGGNSTEDEMSAEAEKQIGAVYAAMFGARNLTGKDDPISWVNVGGGTQTVRYGVLPIVVHNQTLIAKNAGELAAIKAAVSQLSKGSGVALDMKAIEDAAERGAKDALRGLTLAADVDG